MRSERTEKGEGFVLLVSVCDFFVPLYDGVLIATSCSLPQPSSQ